MMDTDMMTLSFPFGAYADGDFLAAALICLLFVVFAISALNHRRLAEYWHSVVKYWSFLYATFIKPHAIEGEVTGQQAALEGFYKVQVWNE